MIDTFVTAARRGDTKAAAGAVSGQDAAFAARAAVWAANLHRVRWAHLSWKAGAVGAAAPDPVRSRLDGEAWVQPVTVTWSLPGESRRASDELWLTFVDEVAPDGTVTRLAGDSDSPVDLAPVPLWLQQPVRLVRGGGVLLLTAAADGERWTTQAANARQAVLARIGAARRDRDQVLVVEVPQSQQVFEQTLGVPPGSYASVAAAAWPRGPDPTTAPVHVVVNPAVSRQLGELGRQVLLTHEAAHVFTRSPQSPAPTWLVEGFADEIAYDAHPAGAVPAEDLVRSAVRAGGSDRTWPSDEDFAPDAADLDLTYDLAWTAAHSLAGKDGAALNRFYAAVDRGRSLAESAEEIGTSERALLHRWRRDLTTLAAR